MKKKALALKSIHDAWRDRLRQYKEDLAKRLWSVTGISEQEKELLFQQHLRDLDPFEKELAEIYAELDSQLRGAGEENNLLRSLMGLSEEDLKTRILSLGHDLQATEKRRLEASAQAEQANKNLSDTQLENEELRKRIRDLEEEVNRIAEDHGAQRQFDIKRFAEANEVIRGKMRELETRLGNLRELFKVTNEKMLVEKQDEITSLQKKLLEDMETTLKKRQELLWGEEEMFAKGVANKVRGALVALQGQLYLTLERLGLMDPESNQESFWKARIRLLVEGAGELSSSFKKVQTLLHDVTATLDDYLHLTHRRGIKKEPVSLVELIQNKVASLYLDRRPTLKLQVLAEDNFPHISGDKKLLQFVVNIMIENAVESLPNESGAIILALKKMPDIKKVELLIHDEGRGIPSHSIKRVFQPFFTTKEGRQGLNLSRAKRYIELHGGELELVKSDSSGTHFRIVLPWEGS